MKYQQTLSTSLLFFSILISHPSLAMCTYQFSEDASIQTQISAKNEGYSTLFESNHKQCWPNQGLSRLSIDISRVNSRYFRESIEPMLSVDKQGWLIVSVTNVKHDFGYLSWQLSIKNHEKNGRIKDCLVYQCEERYTLRCVRID